MYLPYPTRNPQYLLAVGDMQSKKHLVVHRKQPLHMPIASDILSYYCSTLISDLHYGNILHLVHSAETMSPFRLAEAASSRSTPSGSNRTVEETFNDHYNHECEPSGCIRANVCSRQAHLCRTGTYRQRKRADAH